MPPDRAGPPQALSVCWRRLGAVVPQDSSLLQGWTALLLQHAGQCAARLCYCRRFAQGARVAGQPRCALTRRSLVPGIRADRRSRTYDVGYSTALQKTDCHLV